MPEYSVELPTSEKLICFVCKTEHDDEKAFREHYKQFHGKMSEEDAGKLREMVERSLLQNEAISKEYSLRATASRKAFRSEIEITEQILGAAHGHSEVEEAFKKIGQSENSKSQSAYRQFAASESKFDANETSRIDANEASRIDANEGEKSNDAQGSSAADGDDDEPAKKSAFAAALNLQVMS